MASQKRLRPVSHWRDWLPIFHERSGLDALLKSGSLRDCLGRKKNKGPNVSFDYPAIWKILSALKRSQIIYSREIQSIPSSLAIASAFAPPISTRLVELLKLRCCVSFCCPKILKTLRPKIPREIPEKKKKTSLEVKFCDSKKSDHRTNSNTKQSHIFSQSQGCFFLVSNKPSHSVQLLLCHPQRIRVSTPARQAGGDPKRGSNLVFVGEKWNVLVVIFGIYPPNPGVH